MENTTLTEQTAYEIGMEAYHYLLDIYMQHESPGADKASNWLPAPTQGALGVTMRLYAPKAEALDGVGPPQRLSVSSLAPGTRCDGALRNACQSTRLGQLCDL